jgi:hypothetical protein
MTPQAYIAGAAALILAGGGFLAGWKGNNWKRDSQELAVIEATAKGAEAAKVAVVDAIKDLRPIYRTIQGKVERETITVPVYRDCVHTDATWRLLSDAYEALGTGPFPDRDSLPAASPAE